MSRWFGWPQACDPITFLTDGLIIEYMISYMEKNPASWQIIAYVKGPKTPKNSKKTRCKIAKIKERERVCSSIYLSISIRSSFSTECYTYLPVL